MKIRVTALPGVFVGGSVFFLRTLSSQCINAINQFKSKRILLTMALELSKNDRVIWIFKCKLKLHERMMQTSRN